MARLYSLVLLALPALCIPIADQSSNIQQLEQRTTTYPPPEDEGGYQAPTTCSDKSLAFTGWDVSNLVLTQTVTSTQYVNEGEKAPTTTHNTIKVTLSNDAVEYDLTCNGQWDGSSSKAKEILCTGAPSPVEDPEDGSITVTYANGKVTLGVKQSWYCQQSLQSRFWSSGSAQLKPKCESTNPSYLKKVTTCKLATGFVPSQEIRAIA